MRGPTPSSGSFFHNSRLAFQHDMRSPSPAAGTLFCRVVFPILAVRDKASPCKTSVAAWKTRSDKITGKSGLIETPLRSSQKQAIAVAIQQEIIPPRDPETLNAPTSRRPVRTHLVARARDAPSRPGQKA